MPSAGGRPHVLHVLGSAGHDGMATARIVELLAGELGQEYILHACFLGAPGPLSDSLRHVCASAHVLAAGEGSSRISALIRLQQLCRHLDISIVHQHFGGRAVSLAAKSAGARVIVHLHGYIDEARARRASAPVLPGVDAVLANSRATAAAFPRLKARVIYPATGILPDRPPAAHERVIIGTAARLVPVKGLDMLIPAMAGVIASGLDIELEIAGTGPLQSVLQKAAAAAGVAQRVRFLGWVDQLPSVMSNWTVFVLPSRQEGFGIAALDAMAAGLPVVATRVGGIAELVEDGVTGRLIPPGTVEALQSAIMELARNPDLCFAMGAAGQGRARELFSPSHMAAGIRGIYDQLA